MSTKHTAIFAALADEIRITRSKMQIDESVSIRPARIIRGQFMKKPLLLIKTGVGVKAMHDAVSYCLKQYKPDLCVNVGYCGGTVPDASAGDLVLADRVVDTANGKEVSLDSKILDEMRKTCETKVLRHSVGGLATVHRTISTPHEKAYIGTKYNARALDMESFAFVKACKENDTDCAVVRAILDPMDLSLPDFGDALDDEGETSVLGAIKHLVRRPKDIFSIPRIEYCAVQARESIAQFIDVWLA